MENKFISISGARENNLKNVSIDIPKNKITVITGPSGSGKSSLAFDTIYAEGQRRYIESLSSYARQFLGQINPPKLDSISGLSPSIAIDQKTISRNPRSTVGTITEIYDYLRILFARVSKYFDTLGNEIIAYNKSEIADYLEQLNEKTKIQILACIEDANDLKINELFGLGYSRFKIDNKVSVFDPNDFPKDLKSFEVVIDRLVVKDGIRTRLLDSIEQSLKINPTKCIAIINDEEKVFNTSYIDPISLEHYLEKTPALFSYNSPIGACPKCHGLGIFKDFTKEKIIFDPTLSLKDGAVPALIKGNAFFYKMFQSVAISEGIDLLTPFNNLSESDISILLNGSKKTYDYKFESENSKFNFKKEFEGLISWLNKKYVETSSDKRRKDLETFMDQILCPDCKGEKLNFSARNAKIGNETITSLANYSIASLYKFIEELELSSEENEIALQLILEIKKRLTFLKKVGVDYLSLSRTADTLSGGEAQRIRLATQIGSALSGVIYVLDEPSIGLHPRDNNRLIDTIKNLKALGNTVILVEHDLDTMLSADYLIDMGEKGGDAGGKIIQHGPKEDFLKNKTSITSKYLNNIKEVKLKKTDRKIDEFIVLRGAKENNLKSIDVDIPLNNIVTITGVSGSGKSTLVHKVLVPAIKSKIRRESNLYRALPYESITGIDDIKTIIEITQSPIGKTPLSNPATYTGLFDEIRKLFSQTNEAKVQGYKIGRFSFNVKGGRCDSCEGQGVKKIEMHFLPDVFITCKTCKGSRYNSETLSVKFKGLNISDILNMSIEDACKFFKNHKKIYSIVSTLNNLGLGYIKLGQSATTLSGGEAQRVKLAKELAKNTKGKSVYVLDEPTTGLHFADIQLLLEAIEKLVEKGHSVIVIEHNIDFIKNSDYLIDLGPEGGDLGGELVGYGTIEELKKFKDSETAKFL